MGTVTISGVSETTFGDVTGATNYHRLSFVGTPFVSLSTADKGRVLISATRYVTSIGVCDPDTGDDIVPLADDTTIPDDLISGVYELCLDITRDPDLIAAGGTGDVNTKRVKSGSAEVEFFQPRDSSIASAATRRLLLPYLSLSKSGTGEGDSLNNEAFGTEQKDVFSDRKAPNLTEGFY